MSDHVMMVAQNQDHQNIAFRESIREGRAASADDHQDGTASMTLSGTSPQNEEDTLSACKILVQKLNLAGESWSDPQKWEIQSDDVDCIAKNVVDEGVHLRIQVVRAMIDADFWQELSKSREVKKSKIEIQQLANSIADALKKKLSRLTREQRAKLVLALDAIRVPTLALDSVLDCLWKQHTDLLKDTGFQAIWVVGPNQVLTRRIDIPG